MDCAQGDIDDHAAWCNALNNAKPGWVTGSLSHADTRFLFTTAFNSNTHLAVEIGTAAGFSTTVLCHALSFAHEDGRIGADFRVISYDILPTIYFDPSRRVGDATREQLPPELLWHVSFRNPATAADLHQHHDSGSIQLLFIDANHAHPWPTLDLLAVLDCLGPRATVLLHDINLPLRHPEHQVWGAKHLFDDFEGQKAMASDDRLPNMGALVIPDNRERVREQLLQILHTHPWQSDVNSDYLARIGVSRVSQPQEAEDLTVG
jgi:predicted O-methyltransferase YrrM